LKKIVKARSRIFPRSQCELAYSGDNEEVCPGTTFYKSASEQAAHKSLVRSGVYKWVVLTKADREWLDAAARSATALTAGT
jgi:hypothetical protein